MACSYHIVQNSGGENFGELVISKFWQGKLWRMLTPVLLAEEKLGESEGKLSFVNSLKQIVFNDALTQFERSCNQ